MMSNDITWQTHVAQYTLIPTIILTFVVAATSPLLWWYNFVSLKVSLILPWICLMVVSFWISLFGEYVMPHETYKRMQGEPEC